MLSTDCVLEQLYGTHSSEVKLLRLFRDEVLANSALGKSIIKVYNANTAWINEYLAHNETLKRAALATLQTLLPNIERWVSDHQ